VSRGYRKVITFSNGREGWTRVQEKRKESDKRNKKTKPSDKAVY